jgi:hypothetical protein
MEYEIKYARITTTGKLPDRFLNCQSRASSDISKAYMGTFFSLVEIISPWFATSQVGQSIINTFYQSYYNGESTSDLDNFEEALKAVNDNLTKITQAGETNWVGNLNAVLAIQIENKILLAQTGKAEAYIFRQGKINHLTYGLAQNPAEIHPSKTFSNITSGELREHDKVLIANPQLFVSLDLDTIREVISFNTPSQAVLQIAKLLKRKKERLVNVSIIELVSLEEASRMPDDNLSDNIHLDKPIDTVWTHTEKFWQDYLSPVLNFTGKSLQIFANFVFTKTKAYLAKAKERKPKMVLNNDKFHKEFLQTLKSEEGLLKDEEIQYSPELNVHYYEQKEKKLHNQNRFQAFNKSISLCSDLFVWAQKFLKNKNNRRYALIGLGVLCLIIIFFIVSARQGSGKKMSLLDAQTILKSAQGAQKDGKNFFIAGENEDSLLSYEKCIEQAKKVVNIVALKDESTKLLSSCELESDKLTNTTRYTDLKPILALQQDIKDVFVLSGQTYLTTSSEIYRQIAGSSQTEKIASLPKNEGDILFGASSSQSIFLYTSINKIYEYNVSNDDLVVSKNADASWQKANAMEFYNSNLYLLDSNAGQIYKYAYTNGTFSASQNYLNAGFNKIKNAVSLVIDGSIYTLNSTGEVQKVQSGKVQDFPISDIPAPFDKILSPKSIFTGADTNSIYLLDTSKKRIIEIDKEGHFTRQFALPDGFNNINDFVVSSKAKQILIINKNSLYEISI